MKPVLCAGHMGVFSRAAQSNVSTYREGPCIGEDMTHSSGAAGPPKSRMHHWLGAGWGSSKQKMGSATLHLHQETRQASTQSQTHKPGEGLLQ